MSTLDVSQMSMLDLFRVEAENQTQVLTSGLLALERSPNAPAELESCMRAAHSLKGAARIVDIDAGVALAHAMEDCFVAAQQGHILLEQSAIDVLLRGVDLLMSITKAVNLGVEQSGAGIRPDIQAFITDLAAIRAGGTPKASEKPAPPPTALPPTALPAPEELAERSSSPQAVKSEAPAEAESGGRVLRVSVDNLNRMLGLAGESLVVSRWLKPFGESLQRLKRLQYEAGLASDNLRAALFNQTVDERTQLAVTDLQHKILECRSFLSQRLAELEMTDRHSTNLAHRLYDGALACRMRPFADGLLGLPRMVRDVARSLGKQARLEISGKTTRVDRDILEKLDAPLSHLLRNAIDHGIEAPDERRIAGKPDEGIVRLEASHSGGALHIVVSDDGRGIDLSQLRQKVVERGLTNGETAAKLSEAELLEFLFLPGFTTKDSITEISGRGVGLNVVQDMIKQVRGVVRVSSQLGSGTRFHLQLPLTLSVVRALLVDIGGEPYAFPLAHIIRAVRLARSKIETLEGRQHFNLDGRQVGLITAHQIFDCGDLKFTGDELPVVVVSDQNNFYGLVVDAFLGGKELVVQPLDPRLGKIKDIGAGALLEDGSPVLIVDVEDMIRSMERLAHADRLQKVQYDAGGSAVTLKKRVLVIDDSLTVREIQRKILDRAGYEIEVAVDGADGWNAIRAGRFDLVVTDVDMPRMDGIELVGLIKGSPNLRHLPVMIVSYKDAEEDRRRGLDAGADYYLTKASFHDDTLLQAVVDLIGEASA